MAWVQSSIKVRLPARFFRTDRAMPPRPCSQLRESAKTKLDMLGRQDILAHSMLFCPCSSCGLPVFPSILPHIQLLDWINVYVRMTQKHKMVCALGSYTWGGTRCTHKKIKTSQIIITWQKKAYFSVCLFGKWVGGVWVRGAPFYTRCADNLASHAWSWTHWCWAHTHTRPCTCDSVLRPAFAKCNDYLSWRNTCATSNAENDLNPDRYAEWSMEVPLLRSVPKEDEEEEAVAVPKK